MTSELPDLSDYPTLSEYLAADNRILFTLEWLATKAKGDLRETAVQARDAVAEIATAMGHADIDQRLLEQTVVSVLSLGLEMGHDPDAAALVTRINANKKSAASARHSENWEMHAAALAWYREHRGEFESKDAAADAISKFVAAEPSTIRRWLRGA